jgi:hypothetical protein
MRSPCGEYLAACTISPWSSVCTRLRVAMSQMEAVRLSDAETSRVESGEKSTPFIPYSLCEKTLSYVFASHTNTSSPLYLPVPAAIHLPSLDTARQVTSRTAIVAICLPSSTPHTPTPPSPPLKRYSPFAENVTEDILLRTLISIAGFDYKHQRTLHLVSTHRSLSTTWSSATQCSSALVGVTDKQAVVRMPSPHFVHVAPTLHCLVFSAPQPTNRSSSSSTRTARPTSRHPFRESLRLVVGQLYRILLDESTTFVLFSCPFYRLLRPGR